MATRKAPVQSPRVPGKDHRRPVSLSTEQRREMIAESAYFRAERRDFQDGDPVTDWLLSEAEVDQLLASHGRHS